MSGYLCFQIELTRGYDYSAFREDLKKLYNSAGVQGKNTVFLFTDTQVDNRLFHDLCNTGPSTFGNIVIQNDFLKTKSELPKSAITWDKFVVTFEFVPSNSTEGRKKKR